MRRSIAVLAALVVALPVGFAALAPRADDGSGPLGGLGALVDKSAGTSTSRSPGEPAAVPTAESGEGSAGGPTAGPAATPAAGPTAGPAATPAGGPSAPPAGRPPGATTALVSGSVDRTSLALRATYDVDLALRFGDRAVRVDSTATIRNASGGPVDRLELNTVAARLGAIELVRVSVDGVPTTATVDDQTLVVPLGGILPEGASTSVRVVFRARLRATTGGSDWLFTRANGIAELYRWIPWVSRRTPFDRSNHGDPFVTPTSPEVRLRLTADRPLVAALNARRTFVSADRKVQEFVATDVRDLPLALAPDYGVRTARAGDTAIRVVTRPGGPSSALLAAASRALRAMEPLLGPYPWPAYTVVQSAGGHGVEGPGVVWIPIGAANLTYLVAHETAHQWLPGLVGNDQARDPFADEAVADFVARYVTGSRRASRCPTARLDLSIYRYSAACYYEVVYIQGGALLDSLRRTVGSSAFWGGLRDYLAARRFGMGSTVGLFAAIDERTPVDVAARVAPRFPSRY